MGFDNPMFDPMMAADPLAFGFDPMMNNPQDFGFANVVPNDKYI